MASRLFEKPVFDFKFFDSESDEESSADTPDKIREYIEASRPKETKRKIEFWVGRLRDHGRQIGKDKEIVSMTKEELNDLICSFLIDAKKQDGSSYETSTIANFMGVMNRFVKDNKLGDLERETLNIRVHGM